MFSRLTSRAALGPVLAALVLVASPAAAANWYVATTGNDTNPGTQTQPFATFAKAAQVVQPGDTVLVLGGTYTERIQPSRSGTKRKPIRWAANPGDTVTITGVSTCIFVSGLAHLSFDAIDCIGAAPSPNTLVQNGAVVANSQHVTIENSIVRNTKFYGITLVEGTQFSVVRNNTIDTIGEASTSEFGFGEAIYVYNSSQNLIEGNSCAFSGHNLIRVRDSSKNVIRANVLSNHWWRAVEIDGAGDPADDEDGSVHNVVEDNRVFDVRVPSGVVNFPPPAIKLWSPRTILRRNLVWDNRIDGVAVTGDANNPDVSRNLLYHNVIWRNSRAGFVLNDDSSQNDTSGQVVVNNVMQKNGWLHNHGYDLGSLQIDVSLSSPDPLNGAVFFHNLIRDDSTGETVIKVDGISQSPLLWYEANHGYAFWGNLESDPGYPNPAAGNFSISSNSPLVDAGGFLTEATESGSGTWLPVAEADFFSDGFGVQDGDVIQLEGQTSRAKVCSVDYVSGTLQLSHWLSWSSGQGVALAYAGSAPDIGHEEDGLTLEWLSCSGGRRGCGLGFEIAPILLLLAAGRFRARR